ncbi:paralemmin-3 isoform X1 [Homo sapiens]|uniref:paralemmin-3 isoform X1 n=1 Tax=Homo sapiens TaxID=9606 RepID=UPI0005D00A47|nr:paralemmin-3 isoform X1 [Homo sapiens]XP_054188664.1 paralemmin-3 isoform X1 [Homo sapiens]|eukprot:XP_011526267.1 paralemmin-3 isoform X2 [Homo sapiens]
MALQSQVWSLATPMPMAESSLYRQRLEVIARKSLRERWLMDGAAAVPEPSEDPTSKDPQSPEGQAQARIRNLEDSLFTLQSQLQLLQSASTGAQHKPSGRPSWRRQGHRPLSQSIVEAGSVGQTDLNKRASLPAGLVGTPPESPSEPREDVLGFLPGPRQVPGAAGDSSEANGPCPSPIPTPEQGLSQRAVPSEGRVGEAKGGGVVSVVWEGLRATEDCATGATGPELEAKVEEVVLEAIGDRKGAGSLELPAWVKEDRGIVEVVWEGVGGSDAEAMGEIGRVPEVVQTSSPRLQERLEAAASIEGEDVPQGSPEGDGQGGSGGEEGSFIWVERVTLSEEWEELLVEGLEGPEVAGRERGDESPLGAEGAKTGGGEETWEAEKRKAEESMGIGSEEKPGTGRDEAEMSPVVERKGGEKKLELESRGSAEKLGTEREGGEEPLGIERKVEGHLRAEKEGDEEKRGAEEEEVEEPLGVEKKGGEEEPEATKEPLEAERKGGEETLEAEKRGGEESLETEKTQGTEGDLNLEQGSREGSESQAEEMNEAGPPLEANTETRPEKEGPQPQEKPVGALEEEGVKPQTAAEGQGPLGDATPLLAETPAPEQPAECQPLLQGEGPSANPSAHPVPTYAPARQPEPSAPTEGEEASGPKQKTCQCCAVM